MNSPATTIFDFPTSDVSEATANDIASLASTLASAFHNDPVFVWCYPDAERRQQILPSWFAAVLDSSVPYGEVYTTPSASGAAVWIPPGVEEDERLGDKLGDISREYASNLFIAFELMSEHHPDDLHHYLFLLGTRPEWQGKGIGTALMQPVLDRCNRDATPAYLEATSERNRNLYLRQGFVVSGEIKLPNGPSMWPMWREPRLSVR